MQNYRAQDKIKIKLASVTTTSHKENRKDKSGSHIINVKCLATDYDGTISPISEARLRSHIPLRTFALLNRISKSLPIVIITTKDMQFVKCRTPFARAWSAIAGLETEIDRKLLKSDPMVSTLPSIVRAVDYVKRSIRTSKLEIEEKQDTRGRTLAFCVDWRRATNRVEAEEKADLIADYCRKLGLYVIIVEGHPFLDVYPVAPDKGRSLERILEALAIENNVMYLGDSEIDNSAFTKASISIGVVHDESRISNLACDYLVEFKKVPELLRTLIEKNFQFSSDFPMIKTNSLCKNKNRQRLD